MCDPVIRVFRTSVLAQNQIIDHYAGNTFDQLCLVEYPDRSHLIFALVLPYVTYGERIVRVRISEAVEIVVEKFRIELGIVTVLSNEYAKVAPRVVLFPAEVIALLSGISRVLKAFSPSLDSGNLYAYGVLGVEVVHYLVPARCELYACRFAADTGVTAVVIVTAFIKPPCRRLHPDPLARQRIMELRVKTYSLINRLESERTNRTEKICYT